MINKNIPFSTYCANIGLSLAVLFGMRGEPHRANLVDVLSTREGLCAKLDDGSFLPVGLNTVDMEFPNGRMTVLRDVKKGKLTDAIGWSFDTDGDGQSEKSRNFSFEKGVDCRVNLP